MYDHIRKLGPAGVTALLAVAMTHNAWAASDFLGDLDISGYIRAEYGDGDRYPEEDGGDRFEVNQISVLFEALYGDFEAVLLLGATNVTGDSVDSEAFIPEAFIVWNGFTGAGSALSAGVQPLLFGLKAAGFPGDRSVQSSLEFGGAGGFAVSNQSGPALILSYDVGETSVFRAGAFDTSSSTAEYFEDSGLGNINGSSLSDNYFFDLRYQPQGERGFYAFAGIEERYIGDAIDAKRSISDVGVGFQNPLFDLSYEWIELDGDFVGTISDETYSIAELTLHLSQQVDFIADWSEADESKLETMRFGLAYKLNAVLDLQLEYSEDDLAAVGDRPEAVNVDSIDVRLTYNF